MKAAADWPRYLTTRTLADGRKTFCWQPGPADRKRGCPVRSESLGETFAEAASRARMLNEQLDAWRDGRDVPASLRQIDRQGTVDWWFSEYFKSEAFTRLQIVTQADYREALGRISDLATKAVDATGLPILVGQLPVRSMSQAAVDAIYIKLRQGGRITRRADYAIDVARRAWKIVRRAHPGMFLVPVTGPDGKAHQLAINPFENVLRVKRVKETAQPVTRDEVLVFARAAKEAGHPALGVAALICYEWLQRPIDVRSGRITWTDYRPANRPGEVLVFHHKTGQRVWMPLEAADDSEVGRPSVRQLYPELQAMLEKLPRLGVPIVTFEPQRGAKGKDGKRAHKLYSEPHAQHLVQRIRKQASLPDYFTLEACRHGGMTELGDAELPEQLVMSLSGHLTPAAARLYVKRTDHQRLQAAIRRRDYVDRSR